MKKMYQCLKCKKTYPFRKDILTCANHSPYYGYLTIVYDYKNIHFPNGNGSWKKYKDLLPTESFSVHFDEQRTPLIQLKNLGKKYGFTNLFVKDESKNP